MERRDKARYARRLQVHFWKRGDDTAYSGYTANISREGMFIATASPLPKGARIRIEILDEQTGFVVEGVVAHAARVSPQLQKLKASGMGVRLLPVHELVGELMPISQPKKRSKGAKTKGKQRASRTASANSGERRMKPAARVDPGEAPAERKKPLPVLPDDEPKPRPEPGEMPVYPLRFSSLPAFLAVLKRDIAQGGVFIPTDQPAELHEKIFVEVQVPAPVDHKAQFEAVVVSHGESEEPAFEAGDGGENLLSGMAVVFAEDQKAFRELSSIVYGE